MSQDPDDRSAWFRPVSEATMNDPVVGPVLRRLAREDPDLIAAVADVDRSLIRTWLGMSPAERFEYSLNTAAGIAEARRVGR